MSLWRNFETKYYHGMVELKSGNIVAYENNGNFSRRVIETNVKHSINTFPYTDIDKIVIAARKVFPSIPVQK